tara:strand:- start:49 stop:240 length:192 start_codon:yes stop_codon:yes gene_type:complete
MPKKKLTKAQVKAKIKKAYGAIYDLYLDKLGHAGNSEIPMSRDALLKILDPLGRAGVKLNVRF